mmetsp:Transcript_22816/g.58067  ORF Transcript_22816/g.58067 Transcript_22816/m.58067 type:complete len:256 (+) Transcript_22816:808-1575(+)
MPAAPLFLHRPQPPPSPRIVSLCAVCCQLLNQMLMPPLPPSRPGSPPLLLPGGAGKPSSSSHLTSMHLRLHPTTSSQNSSLLSSTAENSDVMERSAARSRVPISRPTNTPIASVTSASHAPSSPSCTGSRERMKSSSSECDQGVVVMAGGSDSGAAPASAGAGPPHGPAAALADAGRTGELGPNPKSTEDILLVLLVLPEDASMGPPYCPSCARSACTSASSSSMYCFAGIFSSPCSLCQRSTSPSTLVFCTPGA